MKRVYCLYRISTKKQVDRNDKDENDIPMQKKNCHEFADRQEGWTILKEFSEKGVSGHKVSAKDRDAIQELKEAAQQKEFDILLVFMFDRIGRIDDETPFVVEWFAKHGIEVWSTQEGQQCFNSHVDKLMNYPRFWQASGESEKTSIRSKMQQMMLEGLYTGGLIRFGYHLVDSGLVNRKGARIRKYEIDPVESEVLHMIDDMTVHKGYGSYRTADFLNKNGYEPNGGGKFTSIKVNRILRDPYYCGRLTTIRYRDSYTRADGTEYSVNEIKYCFYHKSRKLCQCDGQTTYRAQRVDESIRHIIRKMFSGMDGAPEEEKLQAALKRQMVGNRAAQKKLDRELAKDKERLTKLQLEIGKTLTGESSYSADDLSQAIRTIKARIGDAEIKLTQLKDEEEQERQGIEQITPAYDRFKSWAEEFDTATLEQQKMIACHLFKRIEVGRGYQIKAELNMTYRQFCSEWGGNDLLGEAIG